MSTMTTKSNGANHGRKAKDNPAGIHQQRKIVGLGAPALPLHPLRADSYPRRAVFGGVLAMKILLSLPMRLLACAVVVGIVIALIQSSGTGAIGFTLLLIAGLPIILFAEPSNNKISERSLYYTIEMHDTQLAEREERVRKGGKS